MEVARLPKEPKSSVSPAWVINAATWIVHGTTGTCLRTEHTALGISVSLIYNGGIIIVLLYVLCYF